MWANEYRQCTLKSPSKILKFDVWMPVNGCRDGAAIDLFNIGELWQVIGIYGPTLTKEQAQLECANNPKHMLVEGYHGTETF